MARSHATLIFAAALAVNVLLLSQSKLTNVAVQQHDGQVFKAVVSSFRRGVFATESEGSGENVCLPSGSIWNLLLTEPFLVLVRPAFASNTEPVHIISVGPPRCLSKSNVHMSKKNVQALTPSSPSLIPNVTSAPDQKPDDGPLRASPFGSYFFFRHLA